MSIYYHRSSAALSRSKFDLFGDGLLPYIPISILFAATRLPTTAFRALLKFRSVTDRMGSSLMQEKMAALEMGLDQENDIISILSKFSNFYPGLLAESKPVNGLSRLRKTKVTPSELADQIRIILIGGQDTSVSDNSTALCRLDS
jgi:hypothetical protein